MAERENESFNKMKPVTNKDRVARVFISIKTLSFNLCVISCLKVVMLSMWSYYSYLFKFYASNSVFHKTFYSTSLVCERPPERHKA